MTLRIAVLTISDACARGTRQDASGDAIAKWADAAGYKVTERCCVADESGAIVSALISWADGDAADLIITTGGTGLSARDVTPEATRAVIEREAPGIAEALLHAAVPGFPRAMLSRGIAGTRASALIVNLAGSPSAVSDGLVVLSPVVEHAVAILRGTPAGH